MTGISITSETTKSMAPGGAMSDVASRLESLSMFHNSDCPKGESERSQKLECSEAGGLDRHSRVIRFVGRLPLTIGKTRPHRGVGRSIPFFFILLCRNLFGGVESGGSDRLGPILVN